MLAAVALRSLPEFSASTPGVIFEDMIVIGTAVPETLPGAPGDLRAYDVHTGKIRWTFHTIPHPGEFGYDTWPKDAWKYTGGANNWAGMSVDVERSLVFVPTGSAVLPSARKASETGRPAIRRCA